MPSLNSLISLYRHTKLAQRQARRSGSIDAITALAAVAETIALEAGMAAVPAGRTAAAERHPIVSSLPIYRMAPS